MNIFSCPGAMRIKDPIPEFFKCPKCGSDVEIWTHEKSRKCLNCGLVVFREQAPSCIEWCKYGRECVGEEAYNRYMRGKEEVKAKEKRSNLNGEETDNQDR